ncbi:MAG: glycosyltransferase family 2 protein [Candidatus Spyradosoma sp.]
MKLSKNLESYRSSAPTISVVVPVFRAEKFLQACVESVLAQDFSDFELVLVDDGSPDASGKICDDFVRRDARVRVFHEANGGVARARKIGVERSRGEWICFVDADDKLMSGALSVLFAETKNCPAADLVEGAHKRFRETPIDGAFESLPPWGDEAAAKKRGNVCVGGLEYAKEVASHKYFFTTTPWAKIIRKRLIEETGALDLPAWLIHGEDTISCMRMAKKLRRAVRVQTPVYWYRQNPDGACLNPEARRRYTALSYSVAWWKMGKDCFAECGEAWQEVWKIFVESTFLSCVFRKNLKAPELRPFVALLASRKHRVSSGTKLALLGARPPFTFLPSSAFWILFDSFRLPKVALHRARKIFARN